MSSHILNKTICSTEKMKIQRVSVGLKLQEPSFKVVEIQLSPPHLRPLNRRAWEIKHPSGLDSCKKSIASADSLISLGGRQKYLRRMIKFLAAFKVRDMVTGMLF